MNFEYDNIYARKSTYNIIVKQYQFKVDKSMNMTKSVYETGDQKSGSSLDG